MKKPYIVDKIKDSLTNFRSFLSSLKSLRDQVTEKAGKETSGRSEYRE